MNQEQVQSEHAENKSDNKPDDKCVSKHHRPIFEWKYWVEHPAGYLFLSLALTVMSTLAPEKSATKIYFAAAAIWILLGGVIFWIAHGIANRNIPTDEEREQQYRQRIQERFDVMDHRLAGIDKWRMGREVSPQ